MSTRRTTVGRSPQSDLGPHATAHSARSALHEIIRARGTRVLSCHVRLAGVERIAASFVRVTVAGEELTHYTDPRPADAFKLFLPPQPGEQVAAPAYDERGRVRWSTGSDSHDPIVRCFTVRGIDTAAGRISFDVLLHPGGVTARWLAAASTGDRLGFTGFRSEFVDVAASRSLVLIGDASALPAIDEISRAVPATKLRSVLVLADASSSVLTEPTSGATLRWAHSDAELLCGLRDLGPLGPEVQVWVGAEAGLVRRIRRQLLDDSGVDRDALLASAYWKRGLHWEEVFAESMQRFIAAADDGADVTDPGVLQSLAFE